VGFCGGVVPGNAGELHAMTRAGAVGFKCFLTESGVDEFQNVTEADLRIAMPVLAAAGAPLLVHAELSGPIDRVQAARGNLTPEESRRYVAYLESRPRDAENQAVDLMMRLAREYRTTTHVVHLSSSDALSILRAAKDEGVPIQAETCPHYLSITSEEIPDGATEFKCAPPIREGNNREKLWSALQAGLLEQVVTDHSPSTPALKCMDSGDFMKAWGGIASLQLGLAVVWTEARARGAKESDVVRWMCEAPARLAGLSQRKGSIRVGADADLVFWQPDAPFVVAPESLEHRHKLTPYARRTLRGRVKKTFLRGVCIYDSEKGFAAAPSGEWIRGSR
jgi:allantoinase